MATITTRAGKGSPLTNTEVDANFTNLNNDKIENVVEDTTPQLGGNLDTNGNDITFGDNDKAIFGAGSDLQIYHDGNHSYVKDSGTGDLRFLATNLIVNNGGDTQNMFKAIDGGAVTAYHNGSAKLATTATGIDVTGTVTADDELRLDGEAPKVKFFESDTTNVNTSLSQGGGNLFFQTYTDADGFSANRLKIDNTTGDISFYEDTGTTPKLFWDASAESLGIGTTSPDLDLNIEGSGFFGMHLGQQSDNADFSGRLFFSSTSATSGIVGREGGLGFYTGTNIAGSSTGTERVRIDTSGNVGIGTSSPACGLHIDNPSNGAITQILDTDNSAVKLVFRNNTETGNNIQIGADGSNLVAFTGGSEAMRIDSSKNLLVGTTDSTPYNNSAGTSADTGIALRSDGLLSTARYNGILASFNRTGTDGDIIRVLKDGSTVGSIGAEGGDITIDGTTNHSGLRFYLDHLAPRNNGSNSDGAIDLGQASRRFQDLYLSGSARVNSIQSSGSTTSLVFGRNGNEGFRLDGGTGNVLMGHTSSLGNNRQFQVINGAGNAVQSIITAVNGNGGAQLEFVKGRGGVAQNNATIVQNNDALGFIRFFGADGTDLSSEAGRIRCGVDGTPGSNDMPGNLTFQTTADGASSPTERMRIDSSGDVLIGTTAMPGTGNTGGAGFDDVSNDRNILKLGHNADSATKRAMVVFYYKNSAVGQIESSNSSTNYATSSDYRLKENVVDMTGAINRVKALAPKRFNFIVDTDDTTVDGFLAHEAQSVVPEAVTGTHDEVDDDGNAVMQGIDQSKLVPLLTGALQEALAKIEALEERVDALEN